MEIPDKISKIIALKCGNQSNIGQSGANVYIYDDIVLKVQPVSDEAEREVAMMRWLENKLPVPKIIEHIISNKLSFLLISRSAGEMACSDQYMANPKYQGTLLANALQEIWAIDWHECPYRNTLDQKLKQAEFNVANNRIDADNCEPDTFIDFKDPEALLYWLQDNRPTEELSISHGDFCLPNIFFENEELSGLIDLGRSGVADRWCDIALCYRSIKNNFNGRYGRQWPGYSESNFFDALQIKPDWERIRYYILLDELF